MPTNLPALIPYTYSPVTGLSVQKLFNQLKYGKRAINFSTRKVGGLRFVKLGRFCFMFTLTKEYKPL
jgi:hypothetical protein